jgi:hypothetical protein
MRTLAAMTDEIGILSVYVTLDPHRRAENAAKPSWELRLRSQLTEVQERLKATGPRDHYMALTKKLEQLRLEFERLLDPAAPGQGRALFTGVADGTVHQISLQVPLDDRVRLETGAHLHPLVTAWSNAGPAGVVAVSAEAVRAIDLRFGWTEEVAVLHYTSPAEQRERKGPAAANPALAQQSATQQDLFERREEDKLLRYLRTVGPKVGEHAARHEWEFLVVTGEAHLAQAVVDALPGAWADEVITLNHPVTTLTRAKLVATVEPALAEARQRRHWALADRAHQAAMSANAGAIGLGETLDGLQQGRVSHLLLAADRQWSGSRTPDGRLVPDGEVPPGVESGTMSHEPDLGERMIELAFRDSAQVTILDPPYAMPLADADGVGAVLRW